MPDDPRNSDPPSMTATLSLQEWRVVLAGLFELPLKFSGPVVNRLQQQIPGLTQQLGAAS
jgi:hypothetical protein